MRSLFSILLTIAAPLALLCPGTAARAQAVAALPQGVRAVWDLGKAHREATPTRERTCINGLWRWQPVTQRTAHVPGSGWGHFKVPGQWVGSRHYMHRDAHERYPHESWADVDLGKVDMAWYQREITIPRNWAGRRLEVRVEYLNSYAAAYVDGVAAGELRLPGGVLDVTSACRPGKTHVLSLFVVAMPLNAEIMSYAAAEGATRRKGSVLRRGLCGDVFLESTPAGARITDVKVSTSVRKWQITLDAALDGMKLGRSYVLSGLIKEGGHRVATIRSLPFTKKDAEAGRFAFTSAWKPEKLWDVHTPQHQYDVQVSLQDTNGGVLDTYQKVRFGFREFWIDGRDFMLNGTRFHCFAVPLDNAQMGPARAHYDAACESMRRLKTIGVNTLYTHNYGCLPGAHLSFTEILRAADDVGMLVSFSQPHVKDYQWRASDADATNGYARHAEFYVRQAQNHPSVVMYAMNHNMTGYSQDMNPDWIDGVHNPSPDPTGKVKGRVDRAAVLALRAAAIVRRFDDTRVIYHHSSGHLGPMHTSNCYLNFVPIQERSDWFEHWSTEGAKPVFLCEYGVPLRMSWTMHRGWYKGKRSFTNGKLPYQFCTAEWGAQFLGDAAYRLTAPERADLRWEAKQWRAGRTWYRWDYPFQLNNTPALGVPNLDAVQALYIHDNWRAFRTWGVPAFNIWSYGNKWQLRDGVDKSRRDLDVDWENVQRPGFSPDYIDDQYRRVDIGYELSDWVPTEAAKALMRNNQPLLAYIAGKPERFTSKAHIFVTGETVEKQIIVINDSRRTTTCDITWSFGLPRAQKGSKRVAVETGQQARVPLRFSLPDGLAPGEYTLAMSATFGSGETQKDSFVVHVMSRAPKPRVAGKVALFDPKGETASMLREMGVDCETVEADVDLSSYGTLIIGKSALTVDGPAPDLVRVRDGLQVLVFEQQARALEKRLGFRVQEYGLRRVFRRVPDHPALAGIKPGHLRDWRGEATLHPPRLDHGGDPRSVPYVRWCGIKVTRAWRCGNRGSLASVLIEKPALGDFLPIVDGGFGLQYAPLMEYREGKGAVVFCQLDVTDRTATEPAAKRIVSNLLSYVSAMTPRPRRAVLYAGEPEGKAHLEQSGLDVAQYRGGALSPGQVLVLGPGAKVAAHGQVIARFLEADGRVLAIGLDARAANALLPFEVTTTDAEHIDAHFNPAPGASPFAGIAPADVLVRDPRNLPLLTGGVQPLGNGVLGASDDGRVVFCQLVPWHFDYRKHFHTKMTFRRTSSLVMRLLANMGAAADTPLLERLATIADGQAIQSLIKNGDFSADADGDGVADHWQVQPKPKTNGPRRERAAEDSDQWRQRVPSVASAKGASVMLAQHDVPVRKDQWYRISLRARAQGLGGVPVTLTVTNMRNWRSFFKYQRFAPGEQWKRFEFMVQSNAAADSRTRFQIWYATAGTLWVSDVRMEPCDPPSKGPWLTGFYLDEPVEMDDPYRFFRW